MAFITLEDLVGSVEVVIFPRDFEKNQIYLNEEAKVFIKAVYQRKMMQRAN